MGNYKKEDIQYDEIDALLDTLERFLHNSILILKTLALFMRVVCEGIYGRICMQD